MILTNQVEGSFDQQFPNFSFLTDITFVYSEMGF